MLVLDSHRSSGVPVPDIFPIVINLNNAFFGFFHMKGSIDTDFLEVAPCLSYPTATVHMTVQS